MRLFLWVLALVVAQAAFVIFVAAVTGNHAAWFIGGALVGLAIGLALPAYFSRGFTRTRAR